MNTIKYGSSGSDVTNLQQMLNQMGYGLVVDGKFGSATQSAVMQYQAKNGLTVDGIVGANTWGSLNGGGSASQAQANAAGVGNPSYMTNVPNFEIDRPGYVQGQDVTDALNNLQNHQNNKPGDYQSVYGDQIQGMLDQILNRPDFNYDVTKDPLYAQYAEQYQRMGQKAMMNTLGQATALTGGYNNSYAQNVGQQAYQDYLERLNYVVPGLYDAAYGRYRDQGNDMRQNMGLLQGLEDSQYGRYRDTVGDYRWDLDYLTGRSDVLSDRDYNRYMDEYSQWLNMRDFAYKQQMDRQAQDNWLMEFALASSKGSGGGGGGSKTTTNAPVDIAVQIPTSYNEFRKVTGVMPKYDEKEFLALRSKLPELSVFKNYADYLKMEWSKIH